MRTHLVLACFETMHGNNLEGSTYQSWCDIYIVFIKVGVTFISDLSKSNQTYERTVKEEKKTGQKIPCDRIIQDVKTVRIYNVLIKSSLLYGSETWRLTENNKRRVEATEMDALRRTSRLQKKRKN